MAGGKNSPVPMWLTLGFGIGLAFGWFAFGVTPESKAPGAPSSPPAAPVAARPTSIDSPVNAGTLGALELTFQRWGGYAVWENDITEFAAWNPRLKKHADCYEVVRTPVGFYYRTIPALTRPLVDHGLRDDLPLAFTEPKRVRDQFYRDHPGYNPATAPQVELPPAPPEPHGEWLRKVEQRAAVPPPPATTPGDGKE